MARRRGKIVETENPQKQALKVGGNDFDYCVRLFLDGLELRNLAYHTIRWHKENLHYVKQTLEKLDLPTEPIKLVESQFKQCILYWMRESKLYL